MWPYIGSMGWWMVLWWLVAILVLVLVVRLVAGSLASPGSSKRPRVSNTPIA
jgi:hypothetical protein